MREAAAREVVLVQAFETAHPIPPNWGEDDRAWATRLALDDAKPGSSLETFVVRRAHHALQRLGAREPAAAKWLRKGLWRWGWITWAVLVGLVVGLFADSVGGSQHVNLLAPPMWGVVAWNLVVYLLLLGHSLARVLMRPTRAGGLNQLTTRLMRMGRQLPGTGVFSSGGGSAKALQGFAGEWLRLSAPLSAARAATLLHAAAAALGLGLIAGLYLRGLVLDYRAGWESTFLSAVNARAVLKTLLEPAQALSGIAMPDPDAFAAMRVVHGAAESGAPAAPWIHLLALTLALVVVLPRTVLAAFSALRAQWLALRVALPMGTPYFQALALAHQREVARVFVLPYASAPVEPANAALRALIAKALGETAQVEFGATLAFGAEDDAAAITRPPSGTTLCVLLFDLAATPEAEHQGRVARELARHSSTIVAIDETAFARRFKADAVRLAQRRDAWRVLAVALGTTPVFMNAEAPDEAGARGLTLAMRSPVRAVADQDRTS